MAEILWVNPVGSGALDEETVALVDAVGIGVPSSVSGSLRNVGTEMLKTALAFYESYLRQGPTPAGDRTGQTAVALR